MLAEELQHPLHCYASGWLLLSLQGKGTRARGSRAPRTASAKPAVGTALPHSLRAAVRDRLWVCSGGARAHGSPSRPAMGSRCPHHAGSLQEKHTHGRP